MKQIALTIIAILSIFLVMTLVSAITIIEVDEGELVKLKLTSIDEDEDTLTYTFSDPLDEKGQWQTTFGDVGEYLVTITVSDGKAESTEEIKIIVNAVNSPPVLKEIEDIVVKEGDRVKINPKATDREDDPITFTISSPIGNDGVWDVEFDRAGEYEIVVTATDDLHDPVETTFMIIVKDVNQDPIIEDYFPEKDIINIEENEEIPFTVSASDDDGEQLEIVWKVDGIETARGNVFDYHPDFDDAGIHEVEVEVTDKETLLRRTWTVNVESVNRAPSLATIADITINEGELIVLDFDAQDPDGDDILYSIEDPIGSDKEWQTTFEDAGEYEIEVKISDGELKDSQTFTLTVLDVDRAPLFKKIGNIKITEEESVTITLKADDPDGDEITFTSSELPFGAFLEDNIFTYSPTYETVQKPGNFLNRVLNAVYLDKVFYRSTKKFDITFTAAGKKEITQQKIRIAVKNINLPPRLLEMEKITVEETGKVKVRPVAIDPDNDRIKFTATSPLGRDLRWKTDYDDAGEYDVIVTVTDGKRTDEKTVNIIVENKNRAPKFKSIKTKRVKEGQEITISLSVSDADKDRIELSLEDAPEGAFLIDNFIKYTPTFETSIKGERKIMFNVIATDGQDTIKQTIIIKVKNVNRLPIVTTASPGRISNAYVGEPVLFTVEAEDPDNDTLSYKWKFDTFNSYKGTNALRRTFVTPGKKTIKLLISDGKRSITKEWFVNVIERQVKTTTKVTTKVITKQVTTTKKPAGSITYVIDNADIPPPNNVNVLVID